MASSSSSSSIFCHLLLHLAIVLTLITLACSDTETVPVLNSAERESVYRVLESVNSAIQWRAVYPDDLCDSGPHGLLCDYFFTDQTKQHVSLHVTSLTLGFISDSSPSPPCSPNATLASHSFASLSHLRRLFVYRCFTTRHLSLSDHHLWGLSPSLEELVLIENPALYGSLKGRIGGLKSLKKLVLIGSRVSGQIPDEIGGLTKLEQIRISRNRFINGGITEKIGGLKRLRILDLSFNDLTGTVPESIGGLTGLLKLDLGSNGLTGRIPESLVGLKGLVFLDLSYNRFANFGIPMFLGEMKGLREVHLSGNLLGGHVPEIWEKLGGMLGIGLSGVGLVGKIPNSMGVFLRNVSYLGLDNNRLEGPVPEEFGLLEGLNELNLERNLLSGRISFSDKFWARVGGEKMKVKLGGNNGLCVDESQSSNIRALGDLKLCGSSSKPDIPEPVVFFSGCCCLQKFSLCFMVLWLCLVSVFCFVYP